MAIEGNLIGVGTAVPSGAAGGDLTGTYPNPTIGAKKVTAAKLGSAAAASGAVATADGAGGVAYVAPVSGYTIAPQLVARGLVAENMDLQSVAAAGGAALGDSTITLAIVSIPVGTSIAKVGAFITAAGAVGTLFKFGLYKTDGTFCAATADVKAALASNAWLLSSLTAPYVADVSAFYLAALSVGGSPPSLLSWGSVGSGCYAGVNGGVRPVAQVAAQTDLAGNVAPAAAAKAYYMGAG